jgi:hypothetical protein
MRRRLLSGLLVLGATILGIVCLSGAVAITSLMGGSSAWAGESHRIEIGESIGPIKLGMKRKRVHRVYDHKHDNSFHEDTGVLTERYRRGDLDVTYCCGKKKRTRVFSIATISREWVTDRGIGVGDRTIALLSNYHAECFERDYLCMLNTYPSITVFYVDTEWLYIEGIQIYTAEFAPQRLNRVPHGQPR